MISNKVKEREGSQNTNFPRGGSEFMVPIGVDAKKAEYWGFANIFKDLGISDELL